LPKIGRPYMLFINAQLGIHFLMHAMVGTWVESSRLHVQLMPCMPLRMVCFFMP
jgi:hypothetical protein